MTSEWPPDGMEVDHIDCDPTNDKWSNLRLATRAQNCANSTARKNSTGFKGVQARGKKWVAGIKIDGKRVYLGRFDTPEDAHAAYCRAASAHQGEFARTDRGSGADATQRPVKRLPGAFLKRCHAS